MNKQAKVWLTIALTVFVAFMVSVGAVIAVKLLPRFNPPNLPYKEILWVSTAIAFIGFCTVLFALRGKKSDKDSTPATEDKAGEDKVKEDKAGEKTEEKKKTDKKKDDKKKSDSLPVLFLKTTGVIIAIALGLWPLLLMAWLWTKIPSKTLKGLALIVALAVMAMQCYYGLRIKHPEIDDYVGTKVTQIAKEAERTGTKPETTWWMKSIDTPTKLKPSATEHPAHQLTIVEWDKNSVIHFRYKWTTNTGKEKQVDYRWNLAHEPDYGQWTIWEGGKPTQRARWRMEWNQGQGCWIGSEEDTDGAWHSFTIYPRE